MSESIRRCLRLSRPLAIAAHNLHLVCRHCRLVVQLESNVFDKECPHFVAESIRIQVSLVLRKGKSVIAEVLIRAVVFPVS